MATIETREGTKGVRYRAVVRLEGQVQRATFRTKSEAKKWAARIEAGIVEGKHLPAPEAKRKSVADLVERYERTVLAGKRKDAKRCARFWSDRLGTLKLARLTPARVAEVRDELAETRAPATVNRYLAALSHACTVAEREWGWLAANPLRKVRRLKEPRGRVRFLSDDEREALLKAAKDGDHPQLYVIVLIAITTGARRGEILRLRWADVDLNAGRAVLHKTKNDERRSIALVPQVVAELKALRKVRHIDDDLIFRSPATGSDSYFHIEKAWRSAREKAGLEDFRFHDLRHTAASYLAMNGATTAEIAAVLGHKTLAMVKRYAHLSDQHVHDVVERTAAKVLGNR